jgi:epoxyqueuosine reductase QueG
MNLNQELIELLKQEGCHIVGFADIRILPEEQRNGLDVGIIMATTYTPKAVWDRLDDEKRQSIIDNEERGNPLERYNKLTKSFLKEKGYKRNTTYQTMQITYKMLATLAGVGWVGRCALLVSKEQGSAVRFTAVLTNAPFECGTPIMASQCPLDCVACVEICPAKAIKGGLWERGIHRDEFFDVNACKKSRSTCNGLCIAHCPYTQAGLGYK